MPYTINLARARIRDASGTFHDIDAFASQSLTEIKNEFDDKINKLKQDNVVVNNNFYIVPEKFGAKGNGSDDDSEALERAFQQAHDSNVMVFGKGKYLLRKKLTLNDVKFNLHIIFDYGRADATHPQDAAVQPPKNPGDPEIQSGVSYYGDQERIGHLVLENNNQISGIFETVHTMTAGHGAKLIDVTGTNNTIINSKFDSLGAKITFGNAIVLRKTCKNITIENCYFVSCFKKDIDVNGFNIKINNCTFEEHGKNSKIGTFSGYTNALKISLYLGEHKDVYYTYDDDGNPHFIKDAIYCEQEQTSFEDYVKENNEITENDMEDPDVRVNGHDIIITNCYFGEHSDNAIDSYSGGQRVLISNCIFNTPYHRCIEIKSKDQFKLYSHSYIITDCIFIGHGIIIFNDREYFTKQLAKPYYNTTSNNTTTEEDQQPAEQQQDNNENPDARPEGEVEGRDYRYRIILNPVHSLIMSNCICINTCCILKTTKKVNNQTIPDKAYKSVTNGFILRASSIKIDNCIIEEEDQNNPRGLDSTIACYPDQNTGSKHTSTTYKYNANMNDHDPIFAAFTKDMIISNCTVNNFKTLFGDSNGPITIQILGCTFNGTRLANVKEDVIMYINNCNIQTSEYSFLVFGGSLFASNNVIKLNNDATYYFCGGFGRTIYGAPTPLGGTVSLIGNTIINKFNSDQNKTPKLIYISANLGYIPNKIFAMGNNMVDGTVFSNDATLNQQAAFSSLDDVTN